MKDEPFVPAWVFTHNLSAIEIAVLLNLWRRRNAATQQCNPSGSRIARDLKLGRTAVVLAIKRLLEIGLIRHKSGHTGRANEYELFTEPQPVRNTSIPVRVANIPVRNTNTTCSQYEHQGSEGRYLKKVLKEGNKESRVEDLIFKPYTEEEKVRMREIERMRISRILDNYPDVEDKEPDSWTFQSVPWGPRQIMHRTTGRRLEEITASVA